MKESNLNAYISYLELSPNPHIKFVFYFGGRLYRYTDTISQLPVLLCTEFPYSFLRHRRNSSKQIVFGGRGKTWTCNLWVMNPTSYQLLHSAKYRKIRLTHISYLVLTEIAFSEFPNVVLTMNSLIKGWSW